MAKNEIKLTIYRVTAYRDVPIMVQGYGDFFQSVYTYDGNFYQFHTVFTPKKKRHTTDDLKKIITFQLSLAMEAIDYLINPEQMVDKKIEAKDVLKKGIN